jgi:hypothetical protein
MIISKRLTLLFIVVAVVIVLLTVSTGCESGAYYTSSTPLAGDGNLYATQSLANMQADAAAQTAQAVNSAVTAQAQQTVAARDQWFFEQTRTVVAGTAMAVSAQATETAVTRLTETAIAHAQATETTAAKATETSVARACATEIAQAQATSTSEARAVETAVAAPTATLQAAQVKKELTELEWEETTAPIVHILTIVFWIVLIVIGLWTLFWGIPRFYHLLALRLAARDGGGGDKAVLVVPLVGGLWKAWRDFPSLLTYDADRDSGPGQVIKATGEAKLLPGGDAEVTMRDQAVDLMTRPVVAGGRRPSRRAVQQMTQTPAYRILSPSKRPPDQLIDAESIEVLEAEWKAVKDG